jgi:acyl carrier protein
MARVISFDEVMAIVRAEVAKHVPTDFGDADDFQDDLHIASDDLTEIALALEHRFRVKPQRREYLKVTNVDGLANLFHEWISARDSQEW